MYKTNIIVNKTEPDISLKHDINKDIKNFGTCMDKFKNVEYYYNKNINDNIYRYC